MCITRTASSHRILHVQKIGDARDVSLAEVTCAVGQYNPRSDQLRLFTHLHLHLDFKGGDGFFLTKRDQDPFNDGIELVTSALLNRSILSQYINQIVFNPICFGEENLILTTQDLLPAAQTLKTWKNSKGIVTNIVLVNTTTRLSSTISSSTAIIPV